MLKNLSVVILILAFVIFGIFFAPKEDYYRVTSVVNPYELMLDNGAEINLKGFESFKDNLANLEITGDEAFILDNLAKYWAKNILEGRKVKLADNDLVYLKYSYTARFRNSPYCIENDRLTNQYAFDKLIKSIRKGQYVIIDNDNIYPISSRRDGIIIRKRYFRRIKNIETSPKAQKTYKSSIDTNNVKIIVSDSTTKLKPDRNCSSEICKEILSGINNAQTSIDIAIYGYSSTPKIEKAIKDAISRGVKIRLVYDIDTKGGNIYPDTFDFVKLIPANRNDGISKEAGCTMHNKFYIFDNKTVITGSANLSHTDMSGYNTNSIIVINSAKAADIYKQEFEQMFSGKFHTDKTQSTDKQGFDNMKIFFSPQDKAIANGVIPLIKNAKKYIYIPTFVITHRELTAELIKAHSRGVDIKIIADALNASTKHSKHQELRNAGIGVKTENYAGKMHSKTMIIDDEYLIIGSMNFSFSGESKNDENMIILKNPEFAKFYKEFFLYQWGRIPDKWLKFNARAEGFDSIGSCTDGIDNDYDGLTDSADPACVNK